MNWKKIWTGAGLAALVLWVIDGLSYIVAMVMQKLPVGQQLPQMLTPMLMQILPSLVAGVLLAWLYALARPRLGPGPRTAVIMGSIAWALVMLPFFSPSAWMVSPMLSAVFFVFSWIKYVGATAIAGWQYIEKAP